jgi:hypothetical protein
MPEGPDVVGEAERVPRAILLGLALGIVLVLLGRAVR